MNLKSLLYLLGIIIEAVLKNKETNSLGAMRQERRIKSRQDGTIVDLGIHVGVSLLHTRSFITTHT